MERKGLTLQEAAAAVGALIAAANVSDTNVEVVSRWAKEFLKDDETQNAGRDSKTFNVNRWDVRPFNRPTVRTTGLPENCETEVSAGRKHSPIIVVRFLYSYHSSADEEKDSRFVGRDDEFWTRFERTADYLSLHPFLDARRSYHTELQLDKTDLVYFRRELCFEATCRLGVEYADYVKES